MIKPSPHHAVGLCRITFRIDVTQVPAGSSPTHLPLAMQANVKARFQYQRTSFPQISGDGSAYVESVGGHAKLGIRVANDGAGRPLVCPCFAPHYSFISVTPRLGPKQGPKQKLCTKLSVCAPASKAS